MKTKEIMDIALRAGEMLVRSGAEVYRVEDTIKRIFSSYGKSCECFILLSVVFISAQGEDNEAISSMKGIKGYTIDLNRIELVNEFSRGLQSKRLTYNEAVEVLDRIEKKQRYDFPTRLAAASITAFVYTMLFKGSMEESMVALLASFLIYIFKEKISSIGFFQFFEFFTAGVIGGAISILAITLFPGLNLYKMIIGGIMILVPGLAMTNGIKDALYGDTVSSLYRLAEAIFVAVAVGAGVAITLSLGLSWV